MLHNALIAIPRPTHPDTTDPNLTFGQLLDRVPDPDADVHEAVVINLEHARVRRFVRRLPKHERDVIILRFGLGTAALSCREVSARLGISLGSVSGRERRALGRLRVMYGLPGAS